MQRRLIVMRHAKSSWKSDAATDHERPLNKRGRRDAPRVARHLADLDWIPDVVYSSTSQRTRETWKRMRKAWEDLDIPAHFVEAYYHGDLEDIRDSAARWPDQAHTVLVLGHNPGWEAALYQLTQLGAVMTTGNAALLEGQGDTWVDALDHPWELVAVVRPREL